MSRSRKYTHIKEQSTGALDPAEAPLEEGRIHRLSFSRSPFESFHGIPTDQGRQRTPSHELQIKVAEEVPWSDLLLEIAMTTAFASLTDGTQISSASSVASYVTFFALVWWIWATQVAYNMRFRQADVLHRVYVVLQLLVFAALAAFTFNFDITQLSPPMTVQPRYDNKAEFMAAQHRTRGVSIANTRGISMVMALSRLLLLLQYGVVFYYAKSLGRRAISIHLGALSFSTVCYLVAFAVEQGSVAEGKGIAKLVLWFFPIVVELISHYIANLIKGHVKYPAELISKRSASVFIIVLGGGLDKITSGLRILVGNGGFASVPWGLLTCAALIFICQFALYFNSPADKHLSSMRSLSWFFFHFFYLAALIVTLQGIATQLTFGRLGEGYTQVTNALDPIQQFIISNPGTNVSCCDEWPDAKKLYLTNGWALSDDIDWINGNIEWAIESDLNSSLVALNTWDEVYVNDLWSEMDLFNIDPSEDLLGLMAWFVFVADQSNSTQINPTKLAHILDGIWKDQEAPSTWFFAAAGSTLLALIATNTIGRWHKADKWYWMLSASRTVAGVTLILLTSFDVGYSKPEYNTEDQFTPDAFWTLVDKYLILVIVAVILVTEQIVEMILIYLAGNAKSPIVRRPSIQHLMRRSSSQNTIFTSGPLHDEPHDEPFDPTVLYDGVPSRPIKRSSSGYVEEKLTLTP